MVEHRGVVRRGGMEANHGVAGARSVDMTPLPHRALQALDRFTAVHPWDHNAHHHRWILRAAPPQVRPCTGRRLRQRRPGPASRHTRR